jgi:hypothetical protein
MKILSIDVGIKNLAFCLFEKSSPSEHFKITKWDTVNISVKETALTCDFIDKNNNENNACCKPAKFKKNDKCFCLKHSKKQPFLIPKTEQNPTFINKQKIKTLHEIAISYGIKYENKVKKPDLVELINKHIEEIYFQPIESKNAADVNLFEIGSNIKYHFDALFLNEGCIDHVIIENQISPIATRMKTIQGMIVQYFVMCNLQINNIEFISAANKLKDCDAKEKSKYSDRKKLGIAKCLEYITSDIRFNTHLQYFNTHKKKDDLSDSFLQGMWFINNKL